jgi:hypothetical protein
LKKSTRKIAAVTAGVALIAGLTACSTIAEPDQVVLQYTGGSMDGTKFKACIPPTGKGDGKGNNHNFVLPTSLRSWNIALPGQGGDTNDPIITSSLPGPNGEPGPKMKVYGKLEFYLNTSCGKDEKDINAPLPQFWEKVGRRFAADTPEGWNKMLKDTIVTAETSAIKEQVKKYDDDALDANIANIYDVIEVQAGQGMMKSLEATGVGTSFFCGPAYRRNTDVKWLEATLDAAGKVVETEKTGQCPPLRIDITEIEFEDAGIQQARNNVRKAQDQAKADLAAAKAKLDEANILAQANRNGAYLEFERLERDLQIAKERTRQVELCAANPQCTVIVSDGSGVNVSTK